MTILVIGAGAIGGSLGACLARAGHRVLLVDSFAAHVAAIRDGGLRLEGREAFTVPVPAVLPEALAAALAGEVPGTVFLTVKAQHSAAALAPLLPLLGPGSVVVSLQNGLNPHVVAEAVGAGRPLAARINSMAAEPSIRNLPVRWPSRRPLSMMPRNEENSSGTRWTSSRITN